jgi:uncharacterized protein with von Willebrand factor type A (vWA) domain
VAEIASLSVALGRRLGAGPERSIRFARAAQLVSGPEELYWAARAVFCSTREELDAFDTAFGVPDEPRGDPLAPPLHASPSLIANAAERAREHGQEREAVLASASHEERLSEKSFETLSSDELLALRALMRRLALAPPERRSRRARRGRRGERLDLRATIRRSHRTGGDPVEHAYRRRRMRRRRLVMLLDVSGSMASYSRAFIQFLESGVGGADAEAFVFATRLTRLTRALRGRDPEAAIARATAAAPDWSGGTRIAAALKEFNDRYGRRGMARGAVVVILSDGWERGDPADVGREMERLARLAHRIVWVNPRAAAEEFAPLALGMAAAAPHVDALLSGHSMAALDEVVEAIGERRGR